MSDELQNGEAVAEEIPAVVEDQNIGADLATASDEQHEPKAQVDAAAAQLAAANAANQKVISKKHFETKQAQRERDELKSQLDEFNRKEQERVAQTFANNPVMPTVPTDQFADDYEAQMSNYHQDVGTYHSQLQAKATYEANQNALVQQRQYQQQQDAITRQAAAQQVVVGHNARAAALGIDQVEMQKAEDIVLSYEINPDVLNHIAGHEQSPVIVKHLAANPQDGIALAGMSPYGVDVFLAGIAKKAEALAPKKVNAPAPVEQVKGGGAEKTTKYRHIKNATFE